MYNVKSQLQWSDIICKQLFLLPYSTGRTVINYNAECDLIVIAEFLVY